MSTTTSAPRSTASPTPGSSCFDPLDIDRYINFDQYSAFASPSLSPESSRSASSASLHASLGSSNNTLLPTQPSNQQQIFAGPSHQYELHKQQAGLPVGALANTMAVNQADAFQYGRNPLLYGGLPTESYFGMNTTDDYVDFGSTPSVNPSLALPLDMEMDFSSPSQDAFLSSLDATAGEYVDPTAVGGQEDILTPTQPPQANPGRVWPGIHQQQAAEAQAKREALNRQSQKAPQQPRKSNASSSRLPADPIVEERISRLLNQMRNNSVASSNDDDNGGETLNANGNSSHGVKPRKDEDDMDDDERLLASEAGKKLSSKERRQLRNKVSARAFRSRRKEYIGQLEGEIAVKIAEADELRAKNDELMAENARLADLSRMLLSSNAFTNFLNDLSNAPPASSSLTAPAPPSTASSSSAAYSNSPWSSVPKDVNPHQALMGQAQSQQPSLQIGMVTVPETNFNDAPVESNNNAWPNQMAGPGGLFDAQVFATHDLPLGPAVDTQLDMDILSGKSSDGVGSYSVEKSKDEAPAIESMPAAEKCEDLSKAMSSSEDQVELDESDPAFALFIDHAPTGPPSTVSVPKSGEELFGGIELEKAFGRLELVVEDESDEDGEVSTATIARFERFRSILEASSDRITALTSRL